MSPAEANRVLRQAIADHLDTTDTKRDRISLEWALRLTASPVQGAASASVEERDSHRGGNSYEASMLRNLLARIHGDGGHYLEAHGLDKTLEDADQLVAAWRAERAQAQPSAWEAYAMRLRAVLERGYKSIASAALCRTSDGEAAWFAMGAALKIATPAPEQEAAQVGATVPAVVQEALDIALDLAMAEAENVHQAYAGYKPHKHEAVDRDVETIKRAIDAINPAAPVAQEAEQTHQGPSTTACDDQYRSAHVCGLQGYGAAGDECPGCATAANTNKGGE